jgi:membrane protease YdiL (CAAX protease family)
MRNLYYSLTPLAVLLVAITLSSCFGYLVMYGAGDVLPLNKLVSKGTQVLLILSIYPFMRYLQLSKEDIGFAKLNDFFRQFGLGLLLGLVTLLPVMLMLFFFDIKLFNPENIWTVASLIKALSGTLLIGMLVALAEEPLFRGLLLTGLDRKMGAVLAILISATYYAGLHFLRSETEIPYDDLNMLSGFVLAGEAFSNLFSSRVVSAFLALLMVGVFLGLLRTKIKQSLGLCIGCHASWVWQIKMNKKLFITNTDSEFHYLVSSYDGVIGPLVTGWLLLVVAGYLIYQHYRMR